MNFWPIFDSSFSYKLAKNENEINLASQTEEACLMNIQSKTKLDSLNTFLVTVVTVSKKNRFEKNVFKVKFRSLVIFKTL